jgi:hypothetical protein
VYYQVLKKINFLAEISSQLNCYKEEYHINDYYMGCILEAYCQKIIPNIGSKQQKVMMYCILRYMQYDVKLSYSGKDYLVFAKTDTDLYEHPSAVDKKTLYYSIHPSTYYGTNKTMIDVIATPKNKLFTFKITQIPQLKHPKYETKTTQLFGYHYTYYDKNAEPYLFGKIKGIYKDTSLITLIFNKSLLQLYADLPRCNYLDYFNLDLSDTLSKTLATYIKNNIANKNKEDSLKFLIKFARMKSDIKEDKEVYKKEKPMFPEEALYYKYTDSEDRSALLFYLIKSTLKLPMIILDYPNHLNLGVGIMGDFKQFVKFDKRNYYVCEPMDLLTDVKVGESEVYYKHPSPKIMGIYQ